MSNDAGDSTSRLSAALDGIFGGRSDVRDRSAAGEGTESAAFDPDPYELPEIVPATDESPRLPDRADRGESGDRADADPRVPVRATAAPVTEPAPSVAAAPAPAPAPAPASAPTTAWGDHMPTATVAAPVAGNLRAPGRRPRVRRVTRVLRHIDPWSTFKIALLFSAVGYVVALTSGVLLWRVADATGTLDNVERWFTQFGWETFELKGGEIFHNAWVIGLFGVVFATGATVLLVTLFNLVSDIVGGVRMTVLEEEVVERTISSTRRYVVRNPPADTVVRRAPAWSVDDDAAASPARTTADAPPEAAAGARSAGDAEWADEPTRPMPVTDDRAAHGGDTSEHRTPTWSVD